MHESPRSVDYSEIEFKANMKIDTTTGDVTTTLLSIVFSSVGIAYSTLIELSYVRILSSIF